MLWNISINLFSHTFKICINNKWRLYKHNWRQTHYLSVISIFKWTKKFFSNFICFIVFTFWMHSMFFIIVYGRNIVNGMFRVSDFLRLFMMSFKHGLILLKYSSTDSFSFLLPLLLCSYNCHSKNCLLLLVQLYFKLHML